MARTFERWGGLEFSSTYFRCTDAQPPPSRRRILSPTGRWLTGGRYHFHQTVRRGFAFLKKCRPASLVPERSSKICIIESGRVLFLCIWPARSPPYLPPHLQRRGAVPSVCSRFALQPLLLAGCWLVLTPSGLIWFWQWPSLNLQFATVTYVQGNFCPVIAASILVSWSLK